MENSQGVNNRSNAPLKRKIAIILLVSLLVLIVAILKLTELGNDDFRLPQEHKTAEMTELVNSIILKHKGMMEPLARNTYILQWLREHGNAPPEEAYDAPEVINALYTVKLVSKASIVYIMNREGVVTACSKYGNNKTVTGKKYQFRPYFQEALKGKSTIYAAVGVTTGIRGFYFSSPIRSGTSAEPVGVIVMKISLKELDKLLNDAPMETGLITKDGIVFAANKKEWLFKYVAPIGQESMARLIDSKQFGVQSLQPLGSLNQDGIIRIDDKTFEIRTGNLAIPGWQLFTMEQNSGTFPVSFAILVTLIIAVFAFFAISLLVAENRKKEAEQERIYRDEEGKKWATFLQLVLDSLAHPFFITNVNDYTIVHANAAARDGYNDQLTTCHAITHNSDTPCSDCECPLAEVKKTKKAFTTEHIHRDSTGIKKHVEIHAYPIFDENGEVVQIIEYYFDISERKEIEKQLLQSRKLESVGILASGIAHDFNNLLAVINGYVVLVKDKLGPKNPHYRMLESAENVSNKAAVLSEKLTALSKEGWLKKERINTKHIIHQALDYIDKTKTEMETAIPGDLMDAFGDEHQLVQVFHGVLENARDSLEEKGKIILNVKNLYDGQSDLPPTLSKGDYLEITISDNGTGIAQEHIDSIFDPYFSTKALVAGKGLGLGLSICYSIIKKHQGQIAVESEVGKGTTVKIFIPGVKPK